MALDDATVRSALATVIDPELRRPLTDLDMVDTIDITDSTLDVTVALTIVGCPASERIQRDTHQALETIAGERQVTVTLSVMDPTRRQALIERLRGSTTPTMAFGPDSLTRVVAVGSGKGGVGKSTVTANLAAYAASTGLSVGVVDADVFGFSQPGLFGLDGQTPTRIDDMIVPPINYDVKVISIGMFVDPGTPVSWRGPMLHRTVNQFLTDVYFGDLDILFIDMPPGTGDVAISLGQLLPHSDVIVVTTPQPSASDVAIRSGLVARQTGQTVVGVVETFSAGTLPNGVAVDLFGSGGGQRVAESLGVPLLGSIPLSVALREGGDSGTPVVLDVPNDPSSTAIRDVFTALHASRISRVGTPLPVTPR